MSGCIDRPGTEQCVALPSMSTSSWTVKPGVPGTQDAHGRGAASGGGGPVVSVERTWSAEQRGARSRRDLGSMAQQGRSRGAVGGAAGRCGCSVERCGQKWCTPGPCLGAHHNMPKRSVRCHQRDREMGQAGLCLCVRACACMCVCVCTRACVCLLCVCAWNAGVVQVWATQACRVGPHQRGREAGHGRQRKAGPCPVATVALIKHGLR